MVALTSGCLLPPGSRSSVHAWRAPVHSFRDSVCGTVFAMHILSEAMLAMVWAIPRTVSRTFSTDVRRHLSPLPPDAGRDRKGRGAESGTGLEPPAHLVVRPTVRPPVARRRRRPDALSGAGSSLARYRHSALVAVLEQCVAGGKPLDGVQCFRHQPGDPLYRTIRKVHNARPLERLTVTGIPA